MHLCQQLGTARLQEVVLGLQVVVLGLQVVVLELQEVVLELHGVGTRGRDVGSGGRWGVLCQNGYSINILISGSTYSNPTSITTIMSLTISTSVNAIASLANQLFVNISNANVACFGISI